MPNGSLDKWLHPDQETYNGQNNLSLVCRVNIAIDVARALDYLHHDCHQPIVHCDLKPSNVLLDSNMTAHVGDFGLARILPQLTKPNQSSSSVGIKGTIGYAAPGKRPTDNLFETSLNLHKYARTSLPDHVMEIVDPMLLRNDNVITMRQLVNATRLKECLISMVKIGVECSIESSRDRMDMTKVVRELFKIRDVLERNHN
ncbi:hypothetical protein JCGZ_01443 [Jatropha curcas]|uniref:non-specific serine/threonine protein kinase n=1 Tax=Jatropha curcas TaxID=180498 RepID=A0A067LCH0_JATCU|nr:hypothetical protein JCGZ_01443 [Jatropha curcas]